MVKQTIQLLVFHDERVIPKWLYHGYLLCPLDQFPLVQNELMNAKEKSSCKPNKRIHFSDLRSSSHGSSRTRTAVKWARLFIDELYNKIWFYLLGVDLSNVDFRLFGTSTDSSDRDSRIYNRFFEAGLFSACRYFFDAVKEQVEIVNIFSEKRSLERNNPFLTYAPLRMNRRGSNVIVKCRQIIQVAGVISEENTYPECVNTLNFVDVLMGAFSQTIDYTSQSRGCTEVAEKVFPLCRKLMEEPYNINSRYYKRCALSFFPKAKRSKSQLLAYGIKPPENQFYFSRKLHLYQPQCLAGF
jgi:hypothetical protein